MRSGVGLVGRFWVGLGLILGGFGDVSGMFWGVFGNVSGMLWGCFGDVPNLSKTIKNITKPSKNKKNTDFF